MDGRMDGLKMRHNKKGQLRKFQVKVAGLLCTPLNEAYTRALAKTKKEVSTEEADENRALEKKEDKRQLVGIYNMIFPEILIPNPRAIYVESHFLSKLISHCRWRHLQKKRNYTGTVCVVVLCLYRDGEH